VTAEITGESLSAAAARFPTIKGHRAGECQQRQQAAQPGPRPQRSALTRDRRRH
jgi:hypothetical protein